MVRLPEENTQQGTEGRRTKTCLLQRVGSSTCFFQDLPPSTLLFFPFWTGLLHSPHYHCCHRCLLPCGCCHTQGPHGTHRALGQGEEKPGSRTTAGTTSAGACTSLATAKTGAPLRLGNGCTSTAHPMGQGAGMGEPQQCQRWPGSSSGQVTPFLATGSCFTQSKMNKHELVLKQPQISDAIHSPIWAERSSCRLSVGCARGMCAQRAAGGLEQVPEQ